MGRDGKPTRKKILKAAEKLIYENGFAGTSVDLILDKTGLSKGSFFYHFKTKADLALAIIKEFAATDVREMDAAKLDVLKAHTDAKKQLLAFVDYFIDKFSGVKEPPNCIYASVSNEQNQYDDEIKQIVMDTILMWRGTLLEFIEATLLTYNSRVKFDKIALADQFTVIFEGAFTVSKSLNDTSITSKQLRLYQQYLDVLFY